MIKIRSYNDTEHIPEKRGSFSDLSIGLNSAFKKMGIYSEDEDAFVMVPESLNTRRQFKNQIPYLACEYSLMPPFVVQWLKEYNPITFCISNFAAQNLINSGYPKEKVFVSHLAADANFWRPIEVEKFENFTFISVNTSNERSGYEVTVPEFLKFAADKPNVRLVIKDGKNEKFKKWLSSFNSNQIIYIDDRLPDLALRELICRCSVGFYINHTTSFGFLNLTVPLCGIPNICTLDSAIKEFVPEWTQPPKLIKTVKQPLDNNILNYWRDEIGLHTPPNGFYPVGAIREQLDPTNICDSLQYVYDNYSEMLEKNNQFVDIIKREYTWENTAKRIIDVLENN